MVKKRNKKDTLTLAKNYAEFLLYQATGGSMGKEPKTVDGEKAAETATFAEKRGLLDSLIKISSLERKDTDGEDESIFEALRSKASDSAKSGSKRNPWGTSVESSPDIEDGEPGTDGDEIV